jgi:predicted Co/Zn/Cd cation transporter (cation efflux family)
MEDTWTIKKAIPEFLFLQSSHNHITGKWKDGRSENENRFLNKSIQAKLIISKWGVRYGTLARNSVATEDGQMALILI